MEKHDLRKLNDDLEDLLKRQGEAIADYIIEHPSVFITTEIDYDDETGNFKISEDKLVANNEIVNVVPVSYERGDMTGYVDAIGVVLESDGIYILYPDEDSYLCSMKFEDVCIGSYNSILQIFIDGKDFDIKSLLKDDEDDTL